MTREPNTERQPLLWAALIFSAGLWIGAREWRPAVWWVFGVLGFALAAVWFVGRRAWVAKGLSLGTWFLVGALSIQIRGTPGDDPRLRELTDGGEVTITGHVTREGYARASGPRYLSRPIDIETESVERGAEVIDVRSGVRLTVSETVEQTAGEIQGPDSAAKAVGDENLLARLKSCPPNHPPIPLTVPT